MTLLIVLFGGFMLCAGMLLLINPEILFGFLKKYSDSTQLYVSAIVARLVLGGLLVYLAGTSRYPHIIEVIGWIAIIAGVVLGLIGHSKFKSLMNWAIGLQKPLGRFAGLLAIAFGGLIVYAFV